MFKFQKIKDTKLSFILPILSLCLIGAITVFSTTYTDDGMSSLFLNHLAFYLIGFVIFIVLSSFNVEKLKSKTLLFVIIFLSLISLVAVIFIGTEIYGAQRWIDLGIFSFQPSEFVKVSIIIVTAFCLSIRSKKITEEVFNIYSESSKSLQDFKLLIKSEAFMYVFISFVFYLLSVFLIVKQKSLGNSILITLIFLSILLLNLNIGVTRLLSTFPLGIGVILGFNILNLENINSIIGIDSSSNALAIIIVLIALILIAKRFKLNILILSAFLILGLIVQPSMNFAYNNVLEPYQRQRVESFLGNEQSSNIFLNEDFNRQMSILAVGSGRVFGKGFLNGNIVNSRLLPFAYTDFAFAGFAEQFGFAGSLIIIILYSLVLIRIFKTYLKTNDNYFKLICIGVISLIFFNSAQHIAMNMGITPITGVPLPLISYGGSSILSIFIGLGIVNAIDLHDDTEVEIENLKQDYGF